MCILLNVSFILVLLSLKKQIGQGFIEVKCLFVPQDVILDTSSASGCISDEELTSVEAG